MNKLLRAGYAALFRNKFFYIGLIGMALYAVWVGGTHLRDSLIYFRGEYSYDLFSGFTTGMLVLYFLIPAFSAWFIGSEHSEGTLRNKLIVGHSRLSIYFAQLLVVLSAGACFFATHTVINLAFDLPISGGLEHYFPKGAGWTFALSAALIVAMSALYTMIAMICRNKTAAALLSIFLAILMLMIGVMAFTKLTASEYITMIDGLGEDGTLHTVRKIPNPDYPRGVWRKIYTFLLDFVPGGDVLTLANGDTERAWIQIIYDGVIVLVSTAVGIFIFQRKDLK